MTGDRAALLAHATRAGFATVRFAAAGPSPRGPAFDAWIAAESHGEMAWLASTAALRIDPLRRQPSARTAIVMAIQHAHAVPPDPGGRTGRVARYAWGRDYHNLIGKRLDKLKRALRAEGIACWGGVDTAPILERSWAEAAGLGFSGKSCMQIVPARTSWIFLAVLFVDVEVEPDLPITRDHCGACVRCLVGCPTQAFRGPRDLDARRCIAYWTIEARTLAPPDLLAGFGRWIFGCDVCQEVCPHNASPPDPDEVDLLPRHAWLDLDELLATPDDALMERFTGTPLRRPGAAGLKRNALVALGNLGDPGAELSITRGHDHPDAQVRAAAAWAAERLASGTQRG